MGDLATARVKHTMDGVDGYKIINLSDFDPSKDELYDQADEALLTAGGKDEIQRLEAQRQFDANRGVLGTGSAVDTSRNPSGTFSEPTPTDIRYPNKLQTEFENNLGAHVGKSAAEMRAAADLPDAPGGLAPQEAFFETGEVRPPDTSGGTVPQTDRGTTARAGLASDAATVAIPDDWQNLSWPQKRSLAAKLSTGAVTNGPDADAAIQAELDRRNG